MTTSVLSFVYAKHYAKVKEGSTMLLSVLEYMSDVKMKVRFLKEGSLFEEAFEIYTAREQYIDAYRLASAQGWYDKGAALARKLGNNRMESSFTFQNCKSKWDNLTPESPELKQLHMLVNSQDKQTKAHVLLLLGVLKKEVTLCRSARKISSSLRNKIGELEAFNAIVGLEGDESPRAVLDVCSLALITAKALQCDPSRSPSAQQIAQQACNFYGLHDVGQVYLIATCQIQWLHSLGMNIESCKCVDRSTDVDGMLRVQAPATRDLLAKRFENLVQHWVDHFHVQDVLNESVHKFKLHKDITEKFLTRLYSNAEVPSVELENYIRHIVLLLKLNKLLHSPTERIVQDLISVFSPQISLYLPLGKKHISAVRSSKEANMAIQGWIESQLQVDDIKIDKWLYAWRGCCLSSGSMDVLHNKVKHLAERVNEEAGCSAENPEGPKSECTSPAGFVLWRNEKRYYHIFFFWLRSCEMVRKGLALDAAKCAIYHFLCNIAVDKHTFISEMDFVDILTVHCTGILAMLTQLNCHEGVVVQLVVPSLYKHAVEVFNDLNCKCREDCFVLRACSETVKRTKKTRQLRSECVKILWRALDLLLGLHVKDFSVLSYALKQGKALISGASRHCLVIALTLLGNLTWMEAIPPKRSIDLYYKRMQTITARAYEQQNPPKYIVDAFNTFSVSHSIDQLFQLLLGVLQVGDPNASLSHLFVKENKNVGFFEIANSKPMLPQAAWGTQSQALGIPLAPVHIQPDSSLTTVFVQSHPATAVSTSTYSHSLEYSQVVDFKSAEALPSLDSSGTPYTQGTDSGVLPGHPSSETQLSNPIAVNYGAEDFIDELDWEEDDLSIGLASEEPSNKQESSSTANSGIVDAEFCSVCAVSLRVETPAVEGSDEINVQGDVSSKNAPEEDFETYELHVKSKTHQDNEKMHKTLMEEYEWSLSPLLTDLSMVLAECQTLIARCRAFEIKPSSLEVATDELMQVESDVQREISEIHKSAEWQKGIERIQQYSGDIHSLLKRSEKERTTVVERLARLPLEEDPTFQQSSAGSKVVGIDSDDAEVDLELGEVVDEEPQMKPQTLKGKEKSRERKRRRKNKN